jgi:outer membrane protein TolC
LRYGEVSPLELAQSQALLRRAEAVVPPFEADRRRALFRLATLQGKPPAEADTMPVGCAGPPKIDTEIPVGDGAALIVRRPDIREAERKLAAATARIGIVTADLYPRISLGGSAGLKSGVFDAFVTPLISWALLDRNAVRAKIAAARGTEAAALANWDVVMLRALREVESALADYNAEHMRQASLSEALLEHEKAMKRARSRFRLGAESYLIVVDKERSRNEMEGQLSASDLRIAQIQVALFRALGGGWEHNGVRPQ